MANYQETIDPVTGETIFVDEYGDRVDTQEARRETGQNTPTTTALGGWEKRYYEDYATKANAAGLPVLGEQEFVNKYLSSGNYEYGRSQYDKEIGGILTNKYNETAKEYARQTGGSYIPYQGGGDVTQLIKDLGNLQSQVGFATEEKQKKAEAGTTTASTGPVYTFDRTAFEKENADILNAINQSLSGGMPTLQTGDVTKWQEQLAQMYKPYEEGAVRDINVAANFASPATYGSSVQQRNIADALAQSRASQGQQALGLAQGDLATKQAMYGGALQKKFDLADYYEKMKQVSTADAASDFWRTMQRQWGVQDLTTQNQLSNADYNRQRDLAMQLAEMNKPKQPQWYDYVAQIASPILGGIGSGLGYKLMAGAAPAVAGVASNIAGVGGATSKYGRY